MIEKEHRLLNDNNHVERNQLFRKKLDRILNKAIISDDTADDYLDETLEELIHLTEDVLDSYQKTQEASLSNVYKKDIEDSAFEYFGLPEIPTLLHTIVEKYAQAVDASHSGFNPLSLSQDEIPVVPRKFILRRGLFNKVHPALASIIGITATNRLLKTGAIDSLLQLIFFKNVIASQPRGFFVLKKKDSLRYSLETGSEVRQSLALHREFLNTRGPHISIAYMPPGYTQRFHFQRQIPEHNLVVQGLQVLRIRDIENGSSLNGNTGEMFYVPPLVTHAISNESPSVAINCMVKPFFERRSFAEEDFVSSRDHEFVNETSMILKGQRQHFDWGTIIVHQLKTAKNFSYAIALLNILPGKELTLETVEDMKMGSEEVVISFGARSIVEATNGISSNKLLLESGDTLYSNGQSYSLKNVGEHSATLVRVVTKN